ncbi:VOC family protein [Tsuneonella amylolytica]|uniref:VOC family protein n=1 Tax=Tsuneonella amylolytica TaxID=2338327 RepID=UPI000EA978CF|nr:VOC family protein [Tsuneonella amylolytica]
MAGIIGIGGVFFKAPDPAATCDWYGRVLGIEFGEWGGAVFLPATAAAHPGAATVFAPFAADTEYFAPSAEPFMINLMVDDLDAVLVRCGEHGVGPLGAILDEANGRFAHVLDCDGRKVELWEPRPMAPA